MSENERPEDEGGAKPPTGMTTMLIAGLQPDGEFVMAIKGDNPKLHELEFLGRIAIPRELDKFAAEIEREQRKNAPKIVPPKGGFWRGGR